jgi:histidine ammonia-lyase
MIQIGSEEINIGHFEKILFSHDRIGIAESTIEKINKNHEFLVSFSKDKVIYGINTGLGPMSQYKINDSDQKQLQYNLIRSHCSGTGNTIPPLYAKSAMIARLSTLSRAYSGINLSVVNLLKDLINNDVCPILYEHGSVGASGDLVHLAHLALMLIGEGEVFYKGKIEPAHKVFEELNLKPIDIKLREGLALINGTSVMSGISMINLMYAKKLVGWSIWASSLLNELVESYDDHFSVQLNSVKKHAGQNAIAEAMRNIMNDSKLIKKRHDDLYNKKVTETVIEKKVQEYYSLRCVPQILGPVLETINNAISVLEN